MFLCVDLCWEMWLAFLIWSIAYVGVGKLAGLGNPALLRGSQTLGKLVHKMSRSLKHVVSLNDFYIFLQEFWIYWNFEVNSLVAQVVKGLPAMQETWVGSLGQEEYPGEGNGNSLHYSCLENPMDGRAWQATVYGVAKSRTQLSN